MATPSLTKTHNLEAVAARRRGDKLSLSTCFVPVGRTSFTIYAVALREHPGIVKVGQTAKWANRLKSYQCWNLSNGDAVERATRFTLNDAFVDLRSLESHVLAAVGARHPLHHGTEWFNGDFDEVVRLIDQTIAATGLTYDIE